MDELEKIRREPKYIVKSFMKESLRPSMLPYHVSFLGEKKASKDFLKESEQ